MHFQKKHQAKLLIVLVEIDSDGYVDRAFTDLKSYFLQGIYKDDNTLIKALTFGNAERTYQSWFGLTAEQLEEDRRQEGILSNIKLKNLLKILKI